MNHGYFRHPYRWILFDVNAEQREELKLFPFQIDSNIVMASFNETNKKFSLDQCKNQLKIIGIRNHSNFDPNFSLQNT